MKPKQLTSFLQQLESFRHPRLDLEQYATSAQLATSVLYAINEDVGLDGALVADVGCGCGVLMLGALQMGAHFAVGFDIDRGALEVCAENIAGSSLEPDCDLLLMDVCNGAMMGRFNGHFDVAISNPPFGTKNNTGIDLQFVRAGVALLRPVGSFYSLHKTASRDFILRKSKELFGGRVECECIAQLRWNLDATYKHHKAKSVDIDVDLFRFKRVAGE